MKGGWLVEVWLILVVGRREKLGDERDVAGAEKVQFPVPRQSQIQFQVTAAGAWSGCRVQIQLLVATGALLSAACILVGW